LLVNDENSGTESYKTHFLFDVSQCVIKCHHWWSVFSDELYSTHTHNMLNQ